MTGITPASTPRTGHPPRGAALPRSTPEADAVAYCLENGADALAAPAWGAAPPPWAPGRREAFSDFERNTGVDATAADPDIERTWCIAEVDIFRDLSETEMDAIAAAAPMKTYAAGELLYSPHQPCETLFILKRGRIRVFRVSADGRALTTAIIAPGTIFGEMVLLGQRMYDNFAEALDEVVVCVMSRTDVHRLLLADARIATRITEILGRRLTDLDAEHLTDHAG